MLDVRVQISNINYENTLVSVYPLLEKKIQEMYNRHQAAQKQSIPILFLNRLDSATLPVFLSILSKLDYDQKNELVKYSFNSFVGKIESALKKMNGSAKLISGKSGLRRSMEDCIFRQGV